MTALGDLLYVGWRVSGLMRSQWATADSIARAQERRLVATLRHAARHVPHYRGLKIDPDSIRAANDLQRFPILTKSGLQRAQRALCADNVNIDALPSSRTSGSTGQPTLTYFDRKAWLSGKYAQKIRRMVANGVGLFKHVVIVSEDGTDAIAAKEAPGAGWLFRQSFLSIRDTMERHQERLLEWRPDAIYGFPSYFEELIHHCRAAGLDPPKVPLIFTSSEVLRPGVRQAIQSFFGARVCDIYGSTEFKEVAWQCAEGHYHVNHESVWVEGCACAEHADADSQCLTITTLTNRAMPLIRYQVGDMGCVTRVACQCGRASPVLEFQGGREVDWVRLPEGGRVSPYVLTTEIEQIAEIAQYQIRQLALDRLEIGVVLQNPSAAGPDFERARRAIESTLDQAVSVQFNIEPEIQRAPGGKYRVFEQRMDSG